MRTWMAAAGVLVGTVIGCVGPNGINASGGGGSGQGGNGTGTATGTGTGTISGDSGLPCEIADVLSARCISCHNSPPSGGAPMSLLSYADLTTQKNGKSYAQLSVERMQDNTMPPGGGATAADIQAFQNWIGAGTPMGACGDVDAGPPDTTFTDPAAGTCDSTTGNVSQPTCSESKTMNPGMPCIACHSNPSDFSPPCASWSEGGPHFSVAGTVFARGHVPDGCKTDPSKVALNQAKVIITDANGVEHTLPVNSVGNFYFQYSIPKPYQARVAYMGKTRAMSAAQTDGDCNGCHTAQGTNDAPGRIALPQ